MSPLQVVASMKLMTVVMLMAEELGLPVAAIAASVGVGGLAVALARVEHTRESGRRAHHLRGSAGSGR